MDYFKILKRAAEITWQHKYLWVFGFIIALVSGGGSGSYSYQSGTQDQTIGKVGDFLSVYLIVIIIVALLLFVVWLVLWAVSLIAQGGLVNCVKKIEKGEETSLGDGFRVGAHYFWRVLGLSLLLGLVVTVLVLLFVVPLVAVIVLFATQSEKIGAGLTVAGIFCLVLGAIFFFFLFFVLAALLGVAYLYALRYIVLTDQRIVASIRSALKLIRARFVETLVMFMLLLLAGFLFGLVLLVPGLIIGVPAFLLLLAGILAKNVLLIVLAVLGFVVFAVALSAFRGVYQTFHYSAWTLAFMELTPEQ